MTIWAIILLTVTLGLVLLPLLPAMIELYFPKDDKPLKVVQDYDGNIHHFASGFRRYVDARLTPADAALEAQKHDKLSPIASANIAAELQALSAQKKSISQVIISQFPLKLPADTVYESEVYSARQINAGRNSYFRSILSKSTIVLGEYCRVLRWIHSDASLIAGRGCKLFGRASANHTIQLAEQCEFERLQAPRIEFADIASPKVITMVANANQVRVTELSGVKSRFERRWLMQGAFDFPANSAFDGDVIAQTTVDIGAKSRIDGSVKSNGKAVLGPQVTINGALVSTKDIAVGADSYIKGPVIAEQSIHLASGTVIGSQAIPTSVTAPNITVESGVMIFGSVWATEKGLVEAYPTSAKEGSA